MSLVNQSGQRGNTVSVCGKRGRKADNREDLHGKLVEALRGVTEGERWKQARSRTQRKAAADEAKADKEAAEADAAPPAVPAAPHAPHAARAPRAAMPPITGGKLVTGTLNGGGVDIKISTMNGEITLRQSK